MSRGLFLTVEGVEGAGKTTNRDYICGWFKDRGYEVVQTREPGGTPLAERIRELLLTPSDEAMDQRTELLLVFAARSQHYQRVIKPAIERGAIVISDRWVDSTYAYQGAREGLSHEDIDNLSDFVLDGFTPDATFLFDIPVEVGLARASARGRLDRFEQESRDFFCKVQLAFYGQMQRDPGRFRLIDADTTIEGVRAQLDLHLTDLLQNMVLRSYREVAQNNG